MTYFNQPNPEDRIVAVQLRHQSIDGWQIKDVRWTEPIQPGDFEIKEVKAISLNKPPEPRWLATKTKQLVQRLRDIGIRDAQFYHYTFLEQEDLDKYLDQTENKIEELTNELERFGR